MKKALLLCASHNDLGLIRAIRKLGYYIIVTGNIPNLVGQNICDKYIQADYSNKDLILDIAKENQIDAIVQCCNDFGVYTASYVAEKLGLSGYDSYDTTLLLHNKDKFKQFAITNNITTPAFRAFSNKKQAIEYIKNITYPQIIKPIDCSAGNGITKVNNDTEAQDAINYAFEKSREKRIVIEQYITGSQHGFCTFLKNEKVVALCSNNEYSFLNPYRVEIDTFPADNEKIVKETLIQQIEQIATILHLHDGIFHLQYIYDGHKVYILEVMRRILGNMYHIPCNLSTNMDWEYWETRAKCGLNCTGVETECHQEGFYAYKTILSQNNGTIKSIIIPNDYSPYIQNKFMLLHEGDNITHFSSQPIGFLFFQFPSYEKMRELLIDSYYTNNIVIVE